MNNRILWTVFFTVLSLNLLISLYALFRGCSA